MMDTQFITDNDGKKIAVILPIEEYNEILKNLEKLESGRLSDAEQSYKKSNKITSEQERELDSRYNYVLSNSSEGKTWDEIEQTLLSK